MPNAMLFHNPFVEDTFCCMVVPIIEYSFGMDFPLDPPVTTGRGARFTRSLSPIVRSIGFIVVANIEENYSISVRLLIF